MTFWYSGFDDERGEGEWAEALRVAKAIPGVDCCCCSCCSDGSCGISNGKLILQTWIGLVGLVRIAGVMAMGQSSGYSLANPAASQL